MRFWRAFFFSNAFVGLIAVALSAETVLQLCLPPLPGAFYGLQFGLSTCFYSLIYLLTNNRGSVSNPRGLWYRQHKGFMRLICLACLLLAFFSSVILFTHRSLQQLSPLLLLSSACAVAGTLGYYGFLRINAVSPPLRQLGLAKAAIIAFVWATFVTLFPLGTSELLSAQITPHSSLVIWYFVKTFMFCMVNAILFDIKDYAEDANKGTKTLVVQMGLRTLIFQLIMPLLLMGVLSVIFFSVKAGKELWVCLINLIPFFMAFLLAYALKKRRPILYYLFLIDGLLLIKALCGIAASIIEKQAS